MHARKAESPFDQQSAPRQDQDPLSINSIHVILACQYLIDIHYHRAAKGPNQLPQDSIAAYVAGLNLPSDQKVQQHYGRSTHSWSLDLVLPRIGSLVIFPTHRATARCSIARPFEAGVMMSCTGDAGEPHVSLAHVRFTTRRRRSHCPIPSHRQSSR